jgi:hypothetical protein
MHNPPIRIMAKELMPRLGINLKALYLVLEYLHTTLLPWRATIHIISPKIYIVKFGL